MSIDKASIEAWFVDSRDKSNLLKDLVGMLFPKLGGLQVPLHCRQYRYNRTLRERLTLFLWLTRAPTGTAVDAIWLNILPYQSDSRGVDSDTPCKYPVVERRDATVSLVRTPLDSTGC